MRLEFATKARTLALLQTKLTSANILPLQIITVKEWLQDKKGCIDRIDKSFCNNSLIVRSSCNREDRSEHSNAGAFLSIQNVKPEKLKSAIEKVIEAFGIADPTDEILIQPMLTNVIRSGVAFSHDPNTCAPYRVVNWSEGKNTTTVTGGFGGRVLLQAANFKPPPKSMFLPIYNLINELSKVKTI